MIFCGKLLITGFEDLETLPVTLEEVFSGILRPTPGEMKMFDLFLHELKIRRGAILGWGIGIGAFSMVYVGIYPSLGEQMTAFQDVLDLPIYQALGVSDMTTFEGMSPAR
jgi:hypothetical protein